MECRNGYSCFLTTDHDELSKASGVVVSFMGLPEEPTAWIPPGFVPPADQKWVALWGEAPWYFDEHRPYKLFLQALDNIFDWTISYRKDSTFNELYQRGCRYEKREKQLSVNKTSILRQKTNSVLWVVSHCNTTSNRDQYAKELSNAGLVNVTILGKCSESGTKADDAFDNLETYYFYLSFENSLCDDYITEKFFNMLKKNIVPVVMGAPRSDYERIAPPKSFIHVADHAGPEELAKYLEYLQNHQDEYYSYLSWKTWYKLECPESWPACQLCQKLYEDDGRNEDKQIGNFTEFWNKKKCYGQDYTNTNVSKNNF